MISLIPLDAGSGEVFRFSLVRNIAIGSDSARCKLVLPGTGGVHAILTKPAVAPSLLLVAQNGCDTRVNGHCVVCCQTLHHGDVLTIGHHRLLLWEIHREPYSGKAVVNCPVCFGPIQPGDLVMSCPQCGVAHHTDCWIRTLRCGSNICGYDMATPVMDALQRFGCVLERRLPPESALVVQRKEGEVIHPGAFCAAGNKRDRSPFEVNDSVVFCGKCQRPYHLICFLVMAECPHCHWDVRDLVERLFDSQRWITP